MAKSFRKFREEWDDEWENNDDDVRRKERKMMTRRDKRRVKAQEKSSRFDESAED
jgi:hypothetical protein